MCSMHLDRWHRSSLGVQIPVKRYRIGEIVRCSPFSRQTIHNYTIMGLIREAEWTEGGHRLYDETVFDRLSRIDKLRKTKSLAEIRRILREEEHAMPQGPRLGEELFHDQDPCIHRDDRGSRIEDARGENTTHMVT
jgi:DNA-binding transcriptional MerR regulator